MMQVERGGSRGTWKVFTAQALREADHVHVDLNSYSSWAPYDATGSPLWMKPPVFAISRSTNGRTKTAPSKPGAK